MAKQLSDREKAAKKAGVAVDYSKSAKQQAPVRSAFTASKTPAAKLMTAQKSQPIKGYQPLPKGVSGPAAPKQVLYNNALNNFNKAKSNINLMTTQRNQVESVKSSKAFRDASNKIEADKYQQEANKAQEAAKPKNVIKGLGENVKKFARTVASPSTTSSIKDIVQRKTSFKSDVIGGLKSVGKLGVSLASLGNTITQKNPFASKITKELSAAGTKYGEQLNETKLAVKPEEEKGALYGDIATNLIGFVGKSGAVSRAAGDAINALGRSGKTAAEIASGTQAIIKADRAGSFGIKAARAAELTAEERLAQGADNITPTMRSADEIVRSGDNVPIRPIRAYTREIQPTVRDIPEPRVPRSIPRTPDELPQGNHGRSDELFTESDNVGKRKVYANVNDGGRELRKTEIGEWDETGNFVEKTAEDGRPISEVLDESSKNLREGKRGNIRSDRPGDARAAIQNRRKPGLTPLGKGRLTPEADSRLAKTAEEANIQDHIASKIEKLKAQLKNAKGPDEYARISKALDEETSILKDYPKMVPEDKAFFKEKYYREDPNVAQRTVEDYQSTRESNFEMPKIGSLRKGMNERVIRNKGKYNGSKPFNSPVVGETAPKKGLFGMPRTLKGHIKNPFAKDPLLQEAGTPDILYRGEGKVGPRVGSVNNFGDGTYLTNKKSYADKYAADGNSKSYTLSKDAKVFEVGVQTSDDGVDVLYNPKTGEYLDDSVDALLEESQGLSKYAKKNGYDAVKIVRDDGGSGETIVLNKSKLTELWKQAQGGEKKGLLNRSLPGFIKNPFADASFKKAAELNGLKESDLNIDFPDILGGESDSQFSTFQNLFKNPKLRSPDVKDALMNGDAETLRRELVNRGVMTSEQVDNMLYSQDSTIHDVLDSFKSKLSKEDPGLMSGRKVAKNLGLNQPLKQGILRKPGKIAEDVNGAFKKSEVSKSQGSQGLLAKSLKGKVLKENLPRPELSVNSSLANDTTKLEKSQGINLNKLNISPEGKKVISETISDIKPNIEAVVGKKLSNAEAQDFVEKSGKYLSRTIGREQTLEWQSALLNLRKRVALGAESGKVDKNFINDLLTLKSQSTDIARKLNAFKVKAEAEGITKSSILEEVLKVNDNVDEILKKAEGVDFNDFEQATNFYREFIKPKAGEWLDLLRYNSMLSSPNTHIINIFSNLGNSSIIAPIEKLVTGGLDFLASKATGKLRSAYAGEAGHYISGYVKNAGEATHRFAGVMKGSRPMSNIDVRNIPIATRGAKGALVKTLSYPSRLLDGMDQFFTAMVEGGETAALTYRKSKGISVGNIASKAENASRYRLFRRELFDKEQGPVLDAIDQVTNLVNMGRRSKNPIVSTIAKFTVPFINTPMNILKQGIEYSPAGFSTIIGAKNKTEQLSKAIIGSSIFAGSAALLSSGRLTWEEPISEKQKTLFRQAGMQPYSVKIGNKWYSYQKLPPALAFPISMVAAIDDAQKSKKMDQGTADIILGSIAKYGTFLSDQSYAKSIGDMIAGARGDQGGLPRIISNYAQQVVPFRALGGWLARLTDDTQRKIDNQAEFIDKQMQLLMLNIPSVSSKVPARLDSEGNPIKNSNNIINSFSPVKVSENNKKWEGFFNQYKESLRVAQEKSANMQRVKDEVLKTGETQKVGDTNVYLDKGVVKTTKSDAYEIKPLYEQVQELKKSNPSEAQKVVDDLSDEDYDKYTKVRASERAKSSSSFSDLLSTNPRKAVEYVRSQTEEEQQRLVDNMTDEEYQLYEQGK